MSVIKRVKYQDCSDQQLIDIFGQLKEREALVELYERYRVSVGSYLYQDIKSKKTVLDIFNTMIMDLVRKQSSQAYRRDVAVKLFSMAYKRRTEYITNEAQKSIAQLSTASMQGKTEPEIKLAMLPRLHKDVIELVYKNNFSVDQVADIVGRTPSAIRSCLSHIKNQHPLFDSSNSSVRAMNDYANPAEARC